MGQGQPALNRSFGRRRNGGATAIGAEMRAMIGANNIAIRHPATAEKHAAMRAQIARHHNAFGGPKRHQPHIQKYRAEWLVLDGLCDGDRKSMLRKNIPIATRNGAGFRPR